MAAAKPAGKPDMEPIEAVKRLLVLQLYKAGVSTADIGSVLGVSYKTVDRMLPFQKKAVKTKK